MYTVSIYVVSRQYDQLLEQFIIKTKVRFEALQQGWSIVKQWERIFEVEGMKRCFIVEVQCLSTIGLLSLKEVKQNEGFI